MVRFVSLIRVASLNQFQVMLRYAFNFSFWGSWNRSREDSPYCDGRYFTGDCALATRLIGIERQSDTPYDPLNGMASPTVLSTIIPDVLLLLFLAIHRSALERNGLWK